VDVRGGCSEVRGIKSWFCSIELYSIYTIYSIGGCCTCYIAYYTIVLPSDVCSKQTADSGMYTRILTNVCLPLRPNTTTKRQSRFIKRTVLAMNLGTKHTTYKRAGARNVLNGMCKSFEEMWPKSGLT